MKNIYSFKICGLILLLSIAQLNLYAQWQSTNGPLGCRASCFGFSNQASMVGSGGGIYRTTNNGLDWQYVSDANNNMLNIESFTNKDSVLYVCSNMGIFKSLDDGATWNPCWFYGVHFTKLVISDSNMIALRGEQVFLSNNNGDSWSDITPQGINSPLTDAIFFHENIILATSSDGVFTSADDGTSWINTILPGVTTGLRGLACSNSRIFLATFSDGVYYSDDSTLTWQTSSTSFPAYCLIYQSPFLVIGTNQGAMISSDNGVSYSFLGSGMGDASIMSLAFHGTELLAATYGGPFLWDSSELKWKQFVGSGLTGTSMRDILAINDTIFAVDNAYKLQVSYDSGNTWVEDSVQTTGADIFCIKNFQGILFAGSTAYCYSSGDSGKSWRQQFVASCESVVDLVAKDSNILVVTTDLLHLFYRSTDFGQAYQPINLPQGFPTDISHAILLSNDTIFSGTLANGIYYSTDWGSTWNAFNNGLNNQAALSVSQIMRYGDRYYACTQDGLYMYYDNSISWEKAQLGSMIQNNGIHFIAADGNTIIADGCLDQLIISLDSGITWNVLNSGLNIRTLPLMFAISATNFYVGTGGHGVWIYDRSNISFNSILSYNIKNEFSVYPNPSPSGYVNINFGNNKFKNDGRIDVTSQTGQLVYTQQIPANTSYVTLNLSSFNKGIYLASITSEMELLRKVLVIGE